MIAPLGVGYHVIAQMRERGVRMDHNAAGTVRMIVDGAAEHFEVRDLLAAEGCAESTARYRLSKHDLPNPARWFQLGRALHAARLIREQPDLSRKKVAHLMGYSDPSSLSVLLRRQLRLTFRRAQATRPDPVRLAAKWVDRLVGANPVVWRVCAACRTPMQTRAEVEEPKCQKCRRARWGLPADRAVSRSAYFSARYTTRRMAAAREE